MADFEERGWDFMFNNSEIEPRRFHPGLDGIEWDIRHVLQPLAWSRSPLWHRYQPFDTTGIRSSPRARRRWPRWKPDRIVRGRTRHVVDFKRATDWHIAYLAESVFDESCGSLERVGSAPMPLANFAGQSLEIGLGPSLRRDLGWRHGRRRFQAEVLGQAFAVDFARGNDANFTAPRAPEAGSPILRRGR
ncbi:MAG: hypothetical protein R3B70_25910 [Polyangiaceae bacterium]